jgi:hypothetical protein
MKFKFDELLLSDEFRRMCEGLSDEDQQIFKAWTEYGLIESWKEYCESNESRRLGQEESAELEERVLRTLAALYEAIGTLIKKAYTEGVAKGLMMAGRHDLIARSPDLEKAAAVIMAERMNRKGDNDTL